jgi:hypothetical protein
MACAARSISPAPGRIGWCERHPDGSFKPNFAME